MIHQQTPNQAETSANVYCPMCTHTVNAFVVPQQRRGYKVKPGQRCARCHSALDAGVVMWLHQAA